MLLYLYSTYYLLNYLTRAGIEDVEGDGPVTSGSRIARAAADGATGRLEPHLSERAAAN